MKMADAVLALVRHRDFRTFGAGLLAGVLLPKLAGFTRNVQSYCRSVAHGGYQEIEPGILNLSINTSWINLGHWSKGNISYIDACRALAKKLGECAALGENDRVLDVGFGFGDQIKFWADTYQPRSIIGVNISPEETRAAQVGVAMHST